MTEEQMGKSIFSITEDAKDAKKNLNFFKIVLGVALDNLKQFCAKAELEGIETETFNQILATLHLNNRRVYDLIGNAKFIKKLDIEQKYWSELDSAVIKLFRKKNINPMDYWDDIMTLSYSDLEKVID